MLLLASAPCYSSYLCHVTPCVPQVALLRDVEVDHVYCGPFAPTQGTARAVVQQAASQGQLEPDVITLMDAGTTLPATEVGAELLQHRGSARREVQRVERFSAYTT